MNLHDVPDFTPKATPPLSRDAFGRFVARLYDDRLPVVTWDEAGVDQWDDFARRFEEAARRAALGG